MEEEEKQDKSTFGSVGVHSARELNAQMKGLSDMSTDRTKTYEDSAQGREEKKFFGKDERGDRMRESSRMKEQATGEFLGQKHNVLDENYKQKNEEKKNGFFDKLNTLFHKNDDYNEQKRKVIEEAKMKGKLEALETISKRTEEDTRLKYSKTRGQRITETLQKLQKGFQSEMGGLRGVSRGLGGSAPPNILSGGYPKTTSGGKGKYITVTDKKGNKIRYPVDSQSSPYGNVSNVATQLTQTSGTIGNQGIQENRSGQKYFKVTSRTGKVYYRLMESQPRASVASQVNQNFQQQPQDYPNKAAMFLSGGSDNPYAEKARMLMPPRDNQLPYGDRIASMLGGGQSGNQSSDKIVSMMGGSSKGSMSMQDKLGMLSMRRKETGKKVGGTASRQITPDRIRELLR